MFEYFKEKFSNVEFNDFQKRLWVLLKFLIIFNLLAIPLQLVLFFDVNLYPLAYVERAQVSYVLTTFNVKHVLFDVPYSYGFLPAIDLNTKVLVIGEACTAIRSLFAFVALVIASPKSWRHKKKAFLFLPVIYEANILRMVSLAFVSLSFPNLFDIVHIFLWREGLILLIFGLWVFWFRRE
jgi:exosortase/archaeosortase family protein